jgi:amino acid permease
VIIGVLIAFIDGIAIVGIAVFMFPIFKKHNEPIALGYVGFRITEFAIILVYLISPLLLITLSQEYVKAGAPDASNFQTLGAVFQAVRFWAMQMIYIFNFLAGLMLSYLLINQNSFHDLYQSGASLDTHCCYQEPC